MSVLIAYENKSLYWFDKALVQRLSFYKVIRGGSGDKSTSGE